MREAQNEVHCEDLKMTQNWTPERVPKAFFRASSKAKTAAHSCFDRTQKKRPPVRSIKAYLKKRAKKIVLSSEAGFRKWPILEETVPEKKSKMKIQ